MADEEINLDTVRNVWIILNIVLIFYALILFCYGKYFKHKDSLSLVIHIIFKYIILFIQKSITKDNKVFSRPDDTIHINDNKNSLEIDDKKINLIEA